MGEPFAFKTVFRNRFNEEEKKEIIAESKRVGEILEKRSDELHELEQKKWQRN
ncbi:MAG: hypothetical protein MZV64_27215 [Ignavibacteriales bacterium]|nr:hypothetical protein [Ignavibacteriales bacterium]